MKRIKLFEQFIRSEYSISTFPINEDFKTQKTKYISQGHKEDIVDRYLEDFKILKDNKYKEARDSDLEGVNVPKGTDRFDIDKYKDFREVEILVDYISGQRNFGSANFEDIKVDGKPIFENSEVEIYYADTPRACIEYKGDKPYSWCVASKTSNMFYNYRLSEQQPSFYFVKKIKQTEKEFSLWGKTKNVFNGKFKDKWHFFVLQVLKDAGSENNGNLEELGYLDGDFEDLHADKTDSSGEYMITSAMNDGDKYVSWGGVIEIAPELKDLKYLFLSKPLSPAEREKIEKYREGLDDDEFRKLSYKEKKYYLSVYVTGKNKLTDFQFNNLPEDLKNEYIGYGVGLSNSQYQSIKNDSKLIKRYKEITLRKFNILVKEDPGEGFVFQESESEMILDTFSNTKDINILSLILSRLPLNRDQEKKFVSVFLKMWTSENKEKRKKSLTKTLSLPLVPLGENLGYNYKDVRLNIISEIIKEIIELNNFEFDLDLISAYIHLSLSSDKISKEIKEFEGIHQKMNKLMYDSIENPKMKKMSDIENENLLHSLITASSIREPINDRVSNIIIDNIDRFSNGGMILLQSVAIDKFQYYLNKYLDKPGDPNKKIKSIFPYGFLGFLIPYEQERTQIIVDSISRNDIVKFITPELAKKFIEKSKNPEKIRNQIEKKAPGLLK